MIYNGFSQYQFLAGGYDISSYVRSDGVDGFNSLQQKPVWGEVPATPLLTLTCSNPTGEISASNPIGLFHSTTANQSLTGNTSYLLYKGELLRAVPLQIYRKQGSLQILKWNGFIETLTEDYGAKTTKITAATAFSRSQDLPAQLDSTRGTPAAISRGIFQLFNVPCNAVSFNSADAFLSSFIDITLSTDLLRSSETLMSIQKKLAIAGASRIFPYNGEMFFEPFNSTVPIITLDLFPRDLMDKPQITTVEGKFTPYTTNWLGLPSVNSQSFVIGGPSQTNDFGANSSVQIQSFSGAQYNCFTWETISQLKQRQVTFPVSHEIGAMLDLTSFVTLTYPFAGLQKQQLQIVGINDVDRRYTTLIGMTL